MNIIEVEKLKCVCMPYEASKRVVYMIYPMMSVFTEEWLKEQTQNYRCSIVMVYVSFDDWDNYLTPWPEPGVPEGCPPFMGEAAEFYRILTGKVINEAETAMGISDVEERDLIGVSLGGLFTLWQWMQFDVFRSIGCLSGSFWYNGFMEWFDSCKMPRKDGKAFFLLGTEEPKAKVKAFQSVGLNTEAIVAELKTLGINVDFQWVSGDHFADPIQRAELALGSLI